MNNPRPKFSIGEEVSTTFLKSKNHDKVQIINMKYVVLEACKSQFTPRTWFYTGWNYQLDGEIECDVEESYLKKIPPSKRLSFGDMMAKLTPAKDLA